MAHNNKIEVIGNSLCAFLQGWLPLRLIVFVGCKMNKTDELIKIAENLASSTPEFHKDIFKALLAVDSGAEVRRLVFISKPGAIKRHSEPASMAITKWLKVNHGIEKTIFELK